MIKMINDDKVKEVKAFQCKRCKSLYENYKEAEECFWECYDLN